MLVDFSAFVSALLPVLTIGLGFVLAIVIILVMVEPFRVWVEK